MNTIRLLKKSTVACKNSVIIGRVPYALILKKRLELSGNLSTSYDSVTTTTDFITISDILFLLSCFIQTNPQKTISIETPQAA